MCSEPVVTRLDLCGETCPTNFVKTLLALEELEPGDLLEVTIEGQEAMSNVPRSLKQAGHTIVAVERLGQERLQLTVKRG